MNYKKIYQDIINRAKNRPDPPLFEKHHIIPRCLGGLDNPENLVKLTPEEHYVAHQLLVKIYPGNDSLIYAARMMIPNRPNNKMYGWLKRKFISVRRKCFGKNNPSFGTRWISNIEKKASKKIKKTDPLPDGWVVGRNVWKKPNTGPRLAEMSPEERKARTKIRMDKRLETLRKRKRLVPEKIKVDAQYLRKSRRLKREQDYVSKNIVLYNLYVAENISFEKFVVKHKLKFTRNNMFYMVKKIKNFFGV